jgi:hypothetical protein
MTFYLFYLLIFILFDVFFLIFGNGMTKGDYTALHCAACKGHMEIVKALLENKADVNAAAEVSQYVVCVILS